MIDSVYAIDDATDRAVRGVSAQVETIVRENFGLEATYKTLTPDQRFFVTRITSQLVYQATMRNLGKTNG
jgi:hypothetical protein